MFLRFGNLLHNIAYIVFNCLLSLVFESQNRDATCQQPIRTKPQQTEIFLSHTLSLICSIASELYRQR